MTRKPDSWPEGRPEHLPDKTVVSGHVELWKAMNEGWDEEEAEAESIIKGGQCQ